MKLISVSILLISFTLIQSFQIQSNLLTDFPNQCANELGTIMNRGSNNSFVRIGKKYYYIEDTKKMNWIAAAHYCRTLDANLVTIETADEMHLLSQYLLSKGFKQADYFWTSANDLVTDGEFQWLSNGKPMTYSRWSSGNPDNAGGHESCVHLWIEGSEFRMNDWECDKMLYYICESNAPKISITIW